MSDKVCRSSLACPLGAPHHSLPHELDQVATHIADPQVHTRGPLSVSSCKLHESDGECNCSNLGEAVGTVPIRRVLHGGLARCRTQQRNGRDPKGVLLG
jgi:hypothetical protein